MSENVRLGFAGALSLLIFIGFCNSAKQWSESSALERSADRDEDIAECRNNVSRNFDDYAASRQSHRVDSTDFAAIAITKKAMEDCNL